MRTNKVWTPNGYQVGPVNSLVGKGESIIDYANGTGTLVTKGKVGVDNQPSSVQADDQNVIAGNDIDWSTGKKFSDQVAPLTAKLQMYNNIEKKTKENKLSSLSKQTMELQNAQLQRAKAPILDAMKNITDRQEKQHQIEDYAAQVKANRGMDKFDTGKGRVPTGWMNAAYATGIGTEGAMLSRWLREKPIMPSIYAANRYAPAALQTLNKLRVDPYNQLQALNKAERESYYGIQQAGGYTGGQRQNARVALALGNARNAADIYNNTQLQNDKYRQQWATTALAEGNQDAARRQAAAQYGWEAYSKAHGAKTKGIETHLAALGQKAEKYWADRIKNKQYQDTLSIYQDDVNNRKKALQTVFSGTTGGTNISPTAAGVATTPATTSATSRTNAPLTLGAATSNIAPGWTPSNGYFMTPDQWFKANVAYNNLNKTMAASKNKQTFDRLMYGDYGSGFINFNLNDKFSIPTNGMYLNSLLSQERIAGTDDMELLARKPSTLGFSPYGFNIAKYLNMVNNLNY